MFRYDKIRKRRLYLGLTQKKLAELVGVSISIVTRWESGTKLPRAENLGKLCKILRVSPNYFYK
ncbi:MAG: helix-turn-helix transcriptional regulator [Deltaproteobacteria bacterium]|nr:helix-turn-helix transcriptional regulator [Deltaproteobacteria bacterium]